MIKTNKWTMALAAAGVVTLSPFAQAQEAVAPAEVESASIELSGYIATAYAMGSHPASGGGNTFNSGSGSTDKFRMDIVSLTLSKPMGADGTSGFNLGMWIGPEASDLGTQDSGDGGTLELMEANINMMVDVGTGLNLTAGLWGTVVGYEVYDYSANAFYERGWGFAVEPTHHVGVKADYQLNDNIGLTFGVANDYDGFNTNATDDAGSVGYLGAISYAPSEGTFLGDNGFGVYVGTVLGMGADSDETDYYYAAVNLPIPVDGLSVDLAADWVDDDSDADAEIYQVYAFYELSETVTLMGRYEFGDDDITTQKSDISSYAIGVDYALWDGVQTRLEYMTSDWEGASADEESLTLSLVYSF